MTNNAKKFSTVVGRELEEEGRRGGGRGRGRSRREIFNVRQSISGERRTRFNEILDE